MNILLQSLPENDPEAEAFKAFIWKDLSVINLAAKRLLSNDEVIIAILKPVIHQCWVKYKKGIDHRRVRERLYANSSHRLSKQFVVELIKAKDDLEDACKSNAG